eukprot:9845836-Ditylum_brightwellii.AAC.1
MDYSGVNFDEGNNDNDDPNTAFAILQESKFLLLELHLTKKEENKKEEAGDDDDENIRVRRKDSSRLLSDGLYAEAL